MVEIYNDGMKLVELDKDRPIGILDLRSIGYYKVNHFSFANLPSFEPSKTHCYGWRKI